MSTEVEPKDLSPTNIQKIDNDVKSEGELEIDLLDDEHDSVKVLREKMAEKNRLHNPPPTIKKRQIKKSLSSNTSRLHLLTESPSFEITPPSPSDNNCNNNNNIGLELNQKSILRLTAYNNKLALAEKNSGNRARSQKIKNFI